MSKNPNDKPNEPRQEETRKKAEQQELTFEQSMAKMISQEIRSLLVGENDMLMSRQRIRRWWESFPTDQRILNGSHARAKMETLRQAAEAIAQEIKVISVQG